jgi:hypothetical protein
MSAQVTREYGFGGYDPDLPHGNLVREESVDAALGITTITEYGEALRVSVIDVGLGTIVVTQHGGDEPVVEERELTPEEVEQFTPAPVLPSAPDRVTELEATVAALLAALGGE